MRVTDNAIYFWNGTYSQWEPSFFEIDGEKYNCAEQYMMAMKARTFEDFDALSRIMDTSSPLVQKAIGRKVLHFCPRRWGEVCRLIVYRGNLAKFTQNPTMYTELMDSGTKIIVEASPVDKIWGIGLHYNDDRVLDVANWNGTNWLGEAIMQVRSDLSTMKRLGFTP